MSPATGRRYDHGSVDLPALPSRSKYLLKDRETGALCNLADILHYHPAVIWSGTLRDGSLCHAWHRIAEITFRSGVVQSFNKKQSKVEVRNRMKQTATPAKKTGNVVDDNVKNAGFGSGQS